MPSSKKARARARRAAKEAKKAAEPEEKEELSVAMINQERIIEAQMQRLIIGNLMRESNKCRHGVELESHDEKLCREVLEAFGGGYDTCFNNGDHNLVSMLQAGVEAAWGKNISVALNDVAKMEGVLSICVADGVQCILIGNNKTARVNISFAYYFEQLIATKMIDCQRIAELQQGDMKTAVEYLRKRIPCSCLDEKFEEVKSIIKMGLCSNPACSLPERKVERKKMFKCTGCSSTYYCSYECQKAHWSKHKKNCKQIVH